MQIRRSKYSLLLLLNCLGSIQSILSPPFSQTVQGLSPIFSHTVQGTSPPLSQTVQGLSPPVKWSKVYLQHSAKLSKVYLHPFFSSNCPNSKVYLHSFFVVKLSIVRTNTVNLCHTLWVKKIPILSQLHQILQY